MTEQVFVKLDGFKNGPPGIDGKPTILMAVGKDIPNGPSKDWDVRVMFRPETSKGEVIALLRQTIDWLEEQKFDGSLSKTMQAKEGCPNSDLTLFAYR